MTFSSISVEPFAKNLWKKRKKLQFDSKCECCGNPIPKDSEAMTWKEPHSWFRSDFELHVRHTKCHQKFIKPQEQVDLATVLTRITFLLERKSKKQKLEPNGHAAASLGEIARAIKDGWQKNVIGTKDHPITTIEDITRVMPNGWFGLEIRQTKLGWSAAAISRPKYEPKAGLHRSTANYKTEFEARVRLLLLILETEAGVGFTPVKTRNSQ